MRATCRAPQRWQIGAQAHGMLLGAKASMGAPRLCRRDGRRVLPTEAKRGRGYERYRLIGNGRTVPCLQQLSYFFRDQIWSKACAMIAARTMLILAEGEMMGVSS